eukprot:CAMPEP_0184490330 /NCGR_PEP_ID=MMETSP0113_2-20130426/17626_1 /TAXON_ID=91329 /ORGANISM="Norrisiella sphaerica, Strain BC52" /LENGTH=366 /DNA_ID=CAMNT_0026874167 /DNA_START=76 /DNA_END=1176 /DNA_ORIENTATION=+
MLSIVSQLSLVSRSSSSRRLIANATRALSNSSNSDRSKVSICLDWTPNTNHSGIYAAIHENYFKDEGIEMQIIEPSAKEELTPGRKVARGTATFAISSSESAVSFATTEKNVRLVAVAALLQGSTSSICTLSSSGIDRPAKLDGKRYASYDGRFEDAIVKQMVINDGGSGSVKFHSLDFHGYADPETMEEGSVVASYLANKESDSTWIFTHWEAVKASRRGTQLNVFTLEDYGIPYGYSPVLLANSETLEKNPDMIRGVLRALDKGYTFCAENPFRAAEILQLEAKHPSLKDLEFLEESQMKIGNHYLLGDDDEDEGQWGRMDLSRWEAWVNFLFEHGIVTDRKGQTLSRNTIDVKTLFTNEFLPK